MITFYKTDSGELMEVYKEKFTPPAGYKKITATEFNALKEKKQKEENYKTDLLNFGRAVLDFFLAKMFTLTADQKITLISVKEYFNEKGEFPPLDAMAQAEPALYQMVVDAIAAGDLPPLPIPPNE